MLFSKYLEMLQGRRLRENRVARVAMVTHLDFFYFPLVTASNDWYLQACSFLSMRSIAIQSKRNHKLSPLTFKK